MSIDSDKFIKQTHGQIKGVNLMECRLFPELEKPSFAYVNFNEWGKRLHPLFARNKPRDESDQSIVEHLMRLYRVKVLYGGWMEDRSYFLGDTYLKETNSFLHLGVDICVAAGTEVAVTHSCRVLRVDCDTPLKHGWGTSIACQLTDAPYVMVYGHLAPDVIWKPGMWLPQGEILGRIGDREHNGGWFPHLHAQLVHRDVFASFNEDDESWNRFDGYGREVLADVLSRENPDPLPYLGLFP